MEFTKTEQVEIMALDINSDKQLGTTEGNFFWAFGDTKEHKEFYSSLTDDSWSKVPQDLVDVLSAKRYVYKVKLKGEVSDDRRK